MTRVQWTIHPLDEPGDEPPMYAALPDDGTEGLMIGELEDVQLLTKRLTQFLTTSQHDGEISRRDHQLGYKWLTTTEAAAEYSVSRASITLACRNGDIAEAQRRSGSRSWEFPQSAFLTWLASRPGSGPRKRNPLLN